jgi:peptide/nickel transport system ATP-binding protein
MQMTEQTPLLEVNNLKKYFDQNAGIINRLRGNVNKVMAVDDVSLTLGENDVQGVIGESGCGKTTLLMTLMGLETPTHGEIKFRGQPVSEFSKRDWKEFRRNVQIIFQDPFDSLDPKFTVRDTLMEPLQIHNMDNKQERMQEVLADVELNPPERYLDQLPEQLSGGEKQRVSIARALILEPDIIMADEPVSMLDVSTQASVLNMLDRLTDEHGVSMVYISHDLSTVSYVCDTVHVMYLGRLVETAPTLEIINDPKHPYTQALINAIPLIDPYFNRGRVEVEGDPGDPIDIGEGCRFRNRCPERMDICEKTPKTVQVEEDHTAVCHLYYDHDEQTSSEANLTEVQNPVSAQTEVEE